MNQAKKRQRETSSMSKMRKKKSANRQISRAKLNLGLIAIEPIFDGLRTYVRLPSSLCSIILEPKYSNTCLNINKIGN